MRYNNASLKYSYVYPINKTLTNDISLISAECQRAVWVGPPKLLAWHLHTSIAQPIY